MSSHDHDLPFLTQLHSILDESPRADVTGAQIAQTLGIDPGVAEAVQARLIRNGLIEKRNAPRRLGDGHLSSRLDTTPEGADAADRQRLP